MKRFIENRLIAWKNQKHPKPLILRGVRQVGKTWSLRKFGNENFENLAYIDLERNPNWHKIFEKNLDPKRILNELEFIIKQRIVPEKTLLFFDEIQTCLKSIKALRYFYEEIPELHIVAAGSLLEFTLGSYSFPVGRVQFMNLYPMCFIEYLWATDQERLSSLLLSSPVKLPDTVHELLLDELRKYFFIGGMPESIKVYRESGSIIAAIEAQRNITETYRVDFSKYTPQVDKYCLNTVLEKLSQSVGKQIKYSHLAEGYSHPTIKKAFNLLCLSGLVNKISSTDPSGLPLGASASAKIFKAQIVDIGIMQNLTGMQIDTELQQPQLLDIYRGIMAEQFVGQELLAAGQKKLYYWSRQAKSSNAEVDFVIPIKGNIYPIEVKSGPSGKLKSLHSFLHNYPHSPKGIVFSSGPYGETGKVLFIPLYFAFAIGRGGL